MIELRNKNTGLSLIEVLITVLVMAIGMLGFATLQLKTLNTTQESYSRAQAVSVLENLTDRVRANASFVVNDDTNSLTSYAGTDSNLNWCATPPPACASGNSCLGDDLVKSDMRSACDAIEEVGLPNGKLGAKCVDRDTSGDSDDCSIGSKVIFYASWTPTLRKDVEGTGDYTQNNECQSEFNLASSETCVIMELVP